MVHAPLTCLPHPDEHNKTRVGEMRDTSQLEGDVIDVNHGYGLDRCLNLALLQHEKRTVSRMDPKRLNDNKKMGHFVVTVVTNCLVPLTHVHTTAQDLGKHIRMGIPHVPTD
jgi:excinuclease UvrABC helicase subunit UvrB